MTSRDAKNEERTDVIILSVHTRIYWVCSFLTQTTDIHFENWRETAKFLATANEKTKGMTSGSATGLTCGNQKLR
jgi:hypothetical protein